LFMPNRAIIGLIRARPDICTKGKLRSVDGGT
jgi:hypothetical protein